MNHKTEVLNQTKNGYLVFCKTCTIYHLTFGYFYFELTENEFKSFRRYINEINVKFWEAEFSGCKMKRKIPVPTQHPNLYLMLNPADLEELKKLLFFKEKQVKVSLISIEDIDYDFIKN